MIINLKRFEYDYNTMQRKKLNDYCEFPSRINFKPWTKEGIKEKEIKQKRKQQEGGDEASANDEEMSQHEFDEEANRNDLSKNRRKAREGAPIDEDMLLEVESSHSSKSQGVEEDSEGDLMEDDEDENLRMEDTTGKYFDEGVMEDFIDIAPEDDEDDQAKGSKKTKASSSIKGTEAIKPKGKRPVLGGKKGMKKQRNEDVKDDSYYEYELVGVLVHSGSADAGHYYSFIKDRHPGSNRWLEFNDTYVREFDVKNLGQECFGGD